MAGAAPDDIEELAQCSWCRRAFDDAERAPKLLACKHYFCLSCARTALSGAGGCVRCAHCARRTDPPAGRADRLPTHAPVLALVRRLHPPEPEPCAKHRLPAMWCAPCAAPACRACPDHAAHAHALRPQQEARALIQEETRALQAELRMLDARHRDILLRALHATTSLKLRLEAELSANGEDSVSPSDTSTAAAAAAERDRLRAAHADALLRGRLEEVLRGATTPFDFERLRRALVSTTNGSNGFDETAANEETRDPLVFLANYCTCASFSRRVPASAGSTAVAALPASGAASPSPRAPSVSPFPLLFFEVEVDGAPWGRVVVEARSDVAPRMARNFEALATGAAGVGYRGCTVFQCWENESVITGDKRHDNLGLVASQFRIVLREMRGFTAIFGFVAEGLELVDRLSRTGDTAGKPHATILISNCGRLN
ncbi:peptidyl-prolyl cis-trans isomerase E [Phthorimaea operculella]|nr:peptidyl-prolyl cis-trans isomerase E [Phthorimaea operculella]